MSVMFTVCCDVHKRPEKTTTTKNKQTKKTPMKYKEPANFSQFIEKTILSCLCSKYPAAANSHLAQI